MMLPLLRDHVPRSGLPSWGTHMVAELGTHWVGGEGDRSEQKPRRSTEMPGFRLNLELGSWCFSGAWMLELECFLARNSLPTESFRLSLGGLLSELGVERNEGDDQKPRNGCQHHPNKKKL